MPNDIPNTQGGLSLSPAVSAIVSAVSNSAKNLTGNPDLTYERNPAPPPPKPKSPIDYIINAITNIGHGVSYEASKFMQPGKINKQALASALVGQESGGDYSAVSKSTDSKGQHAYGKYQILASNIPAWTKEVLGKAYTIKQFLADQRAQDAVFNWHISNLIEKYGNINDIASVYFSGGPYEKNKNNKDKSGLSVAEYAAQINSRYRNQLSQLAGAAAAVQ